MSSKMMIKFEIKSDRVKGLSFHPNRPWILTSLHSGLIQLWDYHLHTLLEVFKSHTGPVRGICFHNRRPLFVSGGDDYNIKMWNYNQKHCLFTLTGHIDYIRTTIFHHNYPWVVSASDDQTIRIWNWQNRICIGLLSGHTHYVMSATFHPFEDLIVSASLDQSIRIWDISELRKRSNLEVSKEYSNNFNTPNILAQPRGELKYILQGHERGVNWACFHPKLPLIASSSDDHLVKLWRMNDRKVWEIDSCIGHHNNVTCVLFHPKQEVLISSSEDYSIRVWDVSTRTCLQTLQRKQQRFWIMTCHQSLNLFAAGHDEGMIIFKLERERPIYNVHKNYLFYVKDSVLHKLDFKTGKDVLLAQIKIRKRATATRIFFNPLQHTVLICFSCSSIENNFYDLYSIPSEQKVYQPDYKRCSGVAAVWISGNKLAVMDKSHEIFIKNFKDATTKQINMPSCTDMYFGGVDLLLLRDNNLVTLFNVQQKRSIAQIKIDNCRRSVWSLSMSRVALLAKHLLVACDKELNTLFTVQERGSIKSGCWREDELFIYNTHSHIKYALINGDCGIICTIRIPIYITKVEENTVYFLDRNCTPQTLTIKIPEVKFKVLLLQNRIMEAIAVFNNLNLFGESLIAYLQRKGYPEIALHFAVDNEIKFSLALECGNIDIALKAAQALNNRGCWLRLADAALMHGNYKVAEVCHQQTTNYGKLLFLYLITGNLEKLHGIMKSIYLKKDASARFQIALFLGDTKEIIRILNDSKLSILACLASQTYDLVVEKDYDSKGAYFLQPSPPVQITETNWPLLNNPFRNVYAIKPISDNIITSSIEARNDWVNEEEVKGNVALEEAGWDLEGELDLAVATCITLPIKETSKTEIWMKSSQFPLYHIMCGSFVLASQYLHEQVGVVNFHPYKHLFVSIYSGSRTITSWQQNLPPTYSYFIQNVNKMFQSFLQDLQLCYRLTTAGNFAKAIEEFENVLLKITLRPTNNKKEAIETQEILKICSRYILALKMEIFRKSLPKKTNQEKTRQCELAVYFTHCDLQLVHQILTLRTAVKVCFQMKNYKTAISLGKRLLELHPQSNVTAQVQKILRVCNTCPVDEIPLDYDEYNPFKICGASYTAIYQGNLDVKCPLCSITCLPKYKGSICNVCNVAELGKHCGNPGVI